MLIPLSAKLRLLNTAPRRVKAESFPEIDSLRLSVSLRSAGNGNPWFSSLGKSLMNFSKPWKISSTFFQAS
jgi:hypothetical protein